MVPVTCTKCNGSGKIWPRVWFFSFRMTCGTCKGAGKFDPFYHQAAKKESFGKRETPPTPGYNMSPPKDALVRVLSGDVTDIGGLNDEVSTLVQRAVQKALEPDSKAEAGIGDIDYP